MEASVGCPCKWSAPLFLPMIICISPVITRNDADQFWPKHSFKFFVCDIVMWIILFFYCVFLYCNLLHWERITKKWLLKIVTAITTTTTDEHIGQIEGELARMNELMKESSESPDVTAELAKLIKSGLTYSQLYHKYHQTAEQLILEKAENTRINESFDTLLRVCSVAYTSFCCQNKYIVATCTYSVTKDVIYLIIIIILR